MFKFHKLALATAALALTTGAFAQTNPYEKGPTPTVSSLEASRGSFATSSTTVSSFRASGYGAATIYYPTTTGTYAAIALCPGFTATQSSIAWLGPRLASHGFVVMIIDTNTTSDQPASRGRQLKAALTQLVSLNSTSTSSLRGKVDTTRLAVGGHSMGGGGTLEAARDNPSYKAALPLAPWNTTKSFSTIRVPTLIIGGQSDTVAPDAQHSIPFYTSIPTSTPKGFLELTGASHFFPQTANATVGKYMVSWLKRFADNDLRYEQFISGAPHQAAISNTRVISQFRGNGPY